ncbi:MAG: dialkylresorcinol condensing enzyme [Sulfuricurvum sp.]|uniref:dialkylrecorsinol condensing enzyme n=1 Tax=Sulfuricurvum sp. TaxID=2025608 RepID=UPI002633971B|nr:dialkylrecorsinol condensing enzyme [Sulfuricurvum sp.]MDD2829445.1 dialkylresorcinol condensing enzyme [Sulfuricurvum sp.]MDD4948472.1 dialkylresorcinol condensing enzyme [Sulfuricurvum sp.]
MIKRVLVVYYSQSGQLTRVLERMLSPLHENPAIELSIVRLESSEDFTFPWSFWRFFDAFPESVYLDPPNNLPFELENPHEFDLIIIGYQPWFLSPSLPMSAFLLSDEAKIILKDKPVMTVIGCRNMWIEAHKTLKELISKCQGQLIDNVVFSDQSGPLESFITTPRWMLSGKKDSFLGFSRAGISDDDIVSSERFGKRLVEKLQDNSHLINGPMLKNLGAVQVDDRFIAAEKIGKRSFRIWGALIRLFGKRGSKLRLPILSFYILFLITLIITVVPINMMIQAMIRRLFKGKIDKIREILEAPSGR